MSIKPEALAASHVFVVRLLAAQIDQLQYQLREATTTISDLDGNIDALRRQLDERNRDLDKLSQITAQLQQELGDIRANNAKIIEANAIIRKANDELTDQLAALKGEIDPPC